MTEEDTAWSKAVSLTIANMQAAQGEAPGAGPIERPQLLDKEGLATKLLKCADEKRLRGDEVHYANEAKDRLGFLRLYAEVMGFIGKTAVYATPSNTAYNEMKIVLVKPESKHDSKAIEPSVNQDVEFAAVVPLRIKSL
jgi:hypothetical protein